MRLTLSRAAKHQLLKLKRNTGIKPSEALCRWAFCASIAEPAPPPPASIPDDGDVAMSFEAFGGAQSALYRALLEARCAREGLGTDEETLARELRRHVHRGMGYLFADRRIRRVGDLVRRLPLVPRE